MSHFSCKPCTSNWNQVELMISYTFFCNFHHILCSRTLCHFCHVMLRKCGLSRHAVSVCPSVCPSRSYILSKRINISTKFFHWWVAKPFQFFHTNWHGNIPIGTPLTGASNAGGVGRNRDSEPTPGGPK